MVKAKQILHNLFAGLHGFFSFSLVFRLSVILCKHRGHGSCPFLVWKRHNLRCSLGESRSAAPVTLGNTLRTARAQLQQCGTDTDPAAAPTPGAQSLCAVGTQMVREREAKGPAQSPETRDGGGKWTNQASCPFHSRTVSTGTKTFLNKTKQADTREVTDLPNSWGKMGQTDKAF